MKTIDIKLKMLICLFMLSGCCTIFFLRSSSYLTYHEAFVAQAAREMIQSGDWIVPTINQTPWLEKPPAPFWTTAIVGRLLGAIDEWTVRLPFAIAGIILIFLVYQIAEDHFGLRVGVLAGCVQTTTIWYIVRSRLAEADILLVAILTGIVFFFNRFRFFIDKENIQKATFYQYCFYILLGLSSLVKGIGFGAALVLPVVAVVLFWDRDMKSTKKLILNPAGWILFLSIGFWWPVVVYLRYPKALQLWTLHIVDRLASKPTEFSGENPIQYLFAYFWQTLPWTPFAILGVWKSRSGLWNSEDSESSINRTLIAWMIIPALLVSCASARNAHYLIYSYPAWSIQAARSLDRAFSLFSKRGRRLLVSVFPTIGILCAVYHGAIAHRFDRRGQEWKFYQQIHTEILNQKGPVYLLYDDWDRKPYRTPFGSFPHDLGVRLFYLDRSQVLWSDDVRVVDSYKNQYGYQSIFVVARRRDLPVLNRLGDVKERLEGPRVRWDRCFVLFQIESDEEIARTHGISSE